MNCPLRTAFAVSHRFWVVVSSFSFVSRKILISSLISFLTHSLFNSMLFNIHELLCFWVFSLRLVSGFSPLWSEKCLIWFQISWIGWCLFCVMSCGVSLKMFHVYLKRMYILPLWGESFCIYQLSPFDLDYCSMPQYPCILLFVWKIYPLLTVECKNSLQ